MPSAHQPPPVSGPQVRHPAGEAFLVSVEPGRQLLLPQQGTMRRTIHRPDVAQEKQKKPPVEFTDRFVADHELAAQDHLVGTILGDAARRQGGLPGHYHPAQGQRTPQAWTRGWSAYLGKSRLCPPQQVMQRGQAEGQEGQLVQPVQSLAQGATRQALAPGWPAHGTEVYPPTYQGQS